MPSVKDFGARGDGRTDDTRALQHAISRCDGELLFPRGEYVTMRPLQIPLQNTGRMVVGGVGGTATIHMRGAGPAVHVVGNHRGTAEPSGVVAQTWRKERLPMIRDIEIVGGHRQADGVRLDGTFQPTLHAILIRKCRHGVHLTNRNRNVIVANCHIYENSGIGIFFDQVNLHQSIIEGNHISYCKRGGIQIVGSEIRNLQICSNDIEYNYDREAQTSADVLFDCRDGTVREGTIVGNTIQARLSPGGANVRFLGAGADDRVRVGLWAITGNLIGSQTTAIDLQACRGASVTGNSIYSGYHNAIVCENSEHIVISGNSIDHNPQYRGQSTDRVLIRNCRNVNVSGMLHQHTLAAAVAATASMEIRDSENVNVTGSQIINARTRGIHVVNSRLTRIADCTIRGRAGDDTYLAAVDVDERSRQVMVANCYLGRGSSGEFRLPAARGTSSGNVMV